MNLDRQLIISADDVHSAQRAHCWPIRVDLSRRQFFRSRVSSKLRSFGLQTSRVFTFQYFVKLTREDRRTAEKKSPGRHLVPKFSRRTLPT